MRPCQHTPTLKSAWSQGMFPRRQSCHSAYESGTIYFRKGWLLIRLCVGLGHLYGHVTMDGDGELFR